MKKSKIIAIGAAVSGVLVSFGAAFALYVSNASNASFDFSAATGSDSTGTVNYLITNANEGKVAVEGYYDEAGENKGTGISADFPQVHYQFDLGASFANGVPSQSYVLGNLSASLTLLDETLAGKVTVYASLDGYQVGKVGATLYGGTLINNLVPAADALTVSANKDVCVTSNGGQHLSVWVKFNLDGVDLLEKNEAGSLYNLSVNFGDVSQEFNKAYVVCGATNWSPDDKYAMSVNINADNYEWMYNGIGGTNEAGGFEKINCFCNGVWGNADAPLEEGETYDVYWLGGNANPVNAVKRNA